MTVLLWSSLAADGPLSVSTPIIAAAGGLIQANADGPPEIQNLTATLQDSTAHVVVTAGQVTITEDSDLGGDTWRYVARLVAPLTPGNYTIVWQGPESNQTASEPVVVEIGIEPSVASVAALLRARTKVKGGGELGMFTSVTRPTDVEVDLLIEEAMSEVLGKVTPIDPTLPAGSAYNAPGSDYEGRIRGAVRLYTAVLVELSYFPEQVGSSKSPAATYQALYDSRIRALIAEGETGRAEGMGQGASGRGDSPADASWSFPNIAPGGLVGWTSRW